MFELILHPRTKQDYEQFIAAPSQTIQIIGPSGIGKKSLALQLIAAVLDVPAKDLTNYPYFLHITPEKQAISIESIRQAQRFLQHKTLGQKPLRRAILVEDADRMSLEAQNAFLKSLEEPPADSIIVFTVRQPEQLLATIRSRLQSLSVHIPTRAAVFAVSHEEQGFEQAYRLSGGLPGLFHALIAKDETHLLITAVEQARSLLSAPLFSRLILVDSIAAQRDAVPQLLTAVKRIAQAGLETAASKNPDNLARWQGILRASYEAETALEANANLKLTLTELMLAC